MVKANTEAAQKKRKEPAAMWGTANTTAFDVPTDDPIIGKTGVEGQIV